MKHLRKFNSVTAMNTALARATINILGLAYNGSTPVMKMKNTPAGPDYSEPFYIDVRGAVTLAATSGLQMSTDKTNWTDTTATTLSSGKTYFRVATGQSTPLQPNWTEDSNSDYDIGGNINSLVNTSFENDTNCYAFFDGYSGVGFFQYKAKLKSAGNLILPATTLDWGCHYNMFNGCTALTTAPALPAETLAESCYQYMFQDCTALTTAPALPATTLDVVCYSSMFQGCSALTTAPALPATTLANDCYASMFAGCTALTTAPALPATTMVQNCYFGMFQNCTSLTTAPELPATTLFWGCYSQMFSGCTNLNFIKCLATDISATNCTKNWVKDVTASGTFVKNPNMSSWTTDTSGIPSGWTVQDASE